MKKRLLNKEQGKFLKSISAGKSVTEIAEKINKKFGLRLTSIQVRNYKARNKIKSGRIKYQKAKLVTKKEENYIKKIVAGKSNEEVAKLVNLKFGKDLTTEQIKGIKGRNRWSSGLTGRFEKGSVPANKGKKFPGTGNRTTFRKGHISSKHREVGEERINKDGYVEIKIAEPNRWEPKHRIIWEKENGPIPRGNLLIFLDQNKQNIRLDNLMLITKEENARINQNHLRATDKEMTKAGVNIAKIFVAIGRRKNKR